MRKLVYLINKKARFMSILFILVAVSFSVIFGFHTHLNKIYSVLYESRFEIYFLCAFTYIMIYFWTDLMFKIKFEKGKILIRSFLFRIKKEVPIDSVSKLEISKIGIDLSGIMVEKDYRLTIPFLVRGRLDKKDFLYILDLFKNVEIEYKDTTQNEILEFLTEPRNEQNRVAVITSIILLFIIIANLYFSALLFIDMFADIFS